MTVVHPLRRTKDDERESLFFAALKGKVRKVRKILREGALPDKVRSSILVRLVSMVNVETNEIIIREFQAAPNPEPIDWDVVSDASKFCAKQNIKFLLKYSDLHQITLWPGLDRLLELAAEMGPGGIGGLSSLAEHGRVSELARASHAHLRIDELLEVYVLQSEAVRAGVSCGSDRPPRRGWPR